MYVIVVESKEELKELLRGKKVKLMEFNDKAFESLPLEGNKKTTYSAVTDFLLSLGIKPHIKGFKYLEYILSNDIDISEGITVKVYPLIAKVFNTTPSRVERAIRHAIQVGLPHYKNNPMYTKIFGNFTVAPTNLQFIAGCKVYLKTNNQA